MIDWSRYPNFHRAEFDSPDALYSGENMKKEFMEMLQHARDLANRPFVVTSGYRTKEYNERIYKELGKPPTNSAHLRGYAADIACGSSSLRFTIIKAAITAGFKRIGIGKTFVHLDCDPSLPNEVTWLYT